MWYRGTAAVLFVAIGIYILNSAVGVAPEITEKIETVIAVEGGKVGLTCDITPPSTEDDVALVLWYKDESTTPLYSLDSRRRGLYQAKHAPGQEIMGRAFLDMSTNPTILKLEQLKAEDEGEYRCRVDFKIARSRNSLVILEIIIPPKKPIIKDQSEDVLQRVSGPHNLGSRLILICEVEGGKPPPTVTWWKDSILLDDSYQVHSHIVRNELVVDSLDRNDLHSSFSCQASNNNISAPVVTSVTLDMNLPPLEVQIEDKKRALSAQKPVELVCRAGGSRPPANITWTIGRQPLKGTKEKISSEGNITTGRLIFIPTIEDRGKNISCKAENMLIPGSGITDEWQVDVHYVPQLTLKLGSKLRHSHIQEGKDVYLECAIIANPSVSEIGWRFEDRELHTNKSAGIIVSNQSLVLQSVKRSNRGKYTCTADNSEGKGESAPLYLKVQYTPVCKSDQKLLYGVARHEPVKVTCEIEADPSKANFTWKFNNSVESMDILTFITEDSVSIATYIPRTEYDYGTLLCWGKNSVGTQKDPCVFTVIPAGPPDPVQNCSVSNHTEESLMIRCQEAYDGGLQQSFTLETYDAEHITMLNNMSNPAPVFTVYDLTPGTSFVIVIYAYNAKGRSEPKIVRTSTLATPESLTQRDDPWQTTFSPVLIILICVIIVFILIAITIVLVVKSRNRSENEKDVQKQPGNDKTGTPLRQDSDDRREILSTALETEDKCPDVIPGVEMTSDSLKIGDIHKPDRHGDGLPWETRLVNETNTAFSSMDYAPGSWGVHQRPLLKQVPSPSVPQMPTGPLQPLREYTSPNQHPPVPLHTLSPVSTPTSGTTTLRAEWTIPRATNKPKNRQTDV
ncbi:protein turtle homolog B isoform X1 [Parasteatoda tepidariorum]|uniref:protein turtle homolog B isoform X1 n=1 Tax=Parasteatoda tepidariorum TaxID=114398 RepID=UPI0039BD668B